MGGVIKMNTEENKKSSRTIIGIVIAIVISIILIVLISNSVAKKKEAEAFGKREIYSSEEEMQNAMQGTWTHYSEDYGLGRNPLWQYVIKDDLAYMLFNSDDELDYGFKITWNPAKSFGYILIDVNPGMVFGSLRSTAPSLLRTKKSTLVSPLQPSPQ